MKLFVMVKNHNVAWTVSASMFIAAIALASHSRRVSGEVIEYFDHSGFSSNTSALHIVDFDDLPTETILNGDELPGLDITSRRIVVVDPQDFSPGLNIGGSNVNSQPNGLSASIFYSSPGTVAFDNENDDFTFEILVTTEAAGLWVGNVGNSNNDPNTPTTITFLDSSGIEIASEAIRQGHAGQIGTGANNRFFYGITSDVAIRSITVENAAFDGDGILIDDVQWEIPEPTTVAILAVSGLVLHRRRVL